MNIYTNISLLAALTLLSIAFLFIIKNPEIVDKWSNLFYRSAFWLDEKREKRIVSSDLDYRITHVAKSINKESDGILPYGIRIQWKNPEEVISFVQNNNVVIVLRKSDNLDKNIVEACMAYVPAALLPKAKQIVDDRIKHSIDLYTIKKILLLGQYTSSYNYFTKNILEPEITRNSQYQDLINSVNKMDEVGVFTRILLAEYKKIGDLLYGTKEETQYKEETVKFFSFLKDFANRQPGSFKTKLVFLGERIKIAILLVAKKSTLLEWGIKAHLNRIENEINLGVDRIFVFSYTQLEEEVISSEEGYVKDVKYKRSFTALNQIEEACRNISCLKLIKKQNYNTRDVTGRLRTARYLIYQVIR